MASREIREGSDPLLVVFHLPPARFVATATATGLIVDAIRAPVYLWHAGSGLVPLWRPIAIAVAGVTIGTVLGERLLLRLSRERFAQVLGATVGLLGIWLLYSAP